jgi:adenylate kinase
MNIIMIGPQGSGKGTQADLLGPKIGAIKLSTGDLFRAQISDETALGQKIKAILASGNLVSDDITLAMVDGRLNELAADGIGGVIFDGFPRTAAQAEGLDGLLADRSQKIDGVVELVVPDEVLIERMSGRRICSNCRAAYNLAFQNTRQPGICDKCGHELTQRPDDMPDAIRKRLQLYNDLTKPLLDFYGSRGLVTTIDGNQHVESVQQAIIDAISAPAVDSET